MSQGRESFLDLLRFFAASAVLVFHFGFRGYAAHGLQDLAYPELAWFAAYGYLGVELFFMISGYVIPWSIHGRSIGDFAMSRAIRLYPTYWLCAGLLVAVPALLGDGRFAISPRDAAINLTMVAPWFGAPYIDPVFWSLAIELQFYFLVAVVVGFFGFERLPAALLVWLSIGIFTSALAAASGTKPLYLGGTYYMYFCLGAACYFLHHVERSRTVHWLLILSVPAMLAQSAFKAAIVNEIYGDVLNLLAVWALLLGGAAAVLLSHRMSFKHAAAVTFLGGLTYPLYLLHENIGYALLNTLFTPQTRWLGLAFVVAVSYGAAAAVYVWFDQPARRWLRRSLRQLVQPA